MLDLWNKLHFEEEKTKSIYHVQNIQYLYLLNKYKKMQHLEVSGAVRPLKSTSGVKRLMTLREIHAVCFEIHMKHINTLCGENVEILMWNVVPRTYSKHEDFKD